MKAKGKFKPKGASGPIKRSRKQLRKEMRKEKKARKHDYYTNRNRRKTLPNAEEPNVKAPQNVVTKTELEKKSAVTQPLQLKEITSEELQKKAIQKDKRKQEKLQREMAKQRKEQLFKANEDEDRNIKRLGKLLKLNKRKAKAIPKSFAVDGLDYLLEVCDSDNMRSMVETEQNLTEAAGDLEEDFALMTGQSAQKIENKNNLSDNEDLNEDDWQIEDLQSDNSEGELSDNEEELEDLESEDGNSRKTVEKRKLSQKPSGNKKQKTETLNKPDSEDEEDLHSASEFINEENERKTDSDGNESKAEEQSKNQSEVWEDIYGRLRDKDGSIIKEEKVYIPPAIRARMEAQTPTDKKREEKINKLKRQLKGLLNRLAESNMHSIATQAEDLYMNNSRHDMNETLAQLIFDSLITPVITPERLLLEHIMLVVILHANVGTEIGAHFLQTVVKKFDEIYKAELPGGNKMLDNTVLIVAQLYNFKVFQVQLLFEILNKLSERFTETDIECILLILKSVGFSMRKDDPAALKDLILNLQKRANNATEAKENPRVKFMLDILLAVKNNNISKIPNYDTSYSEHLKKLLRNFIRKGSYVTTLNIALEDLLKAEEYGKWWVVGSAWTGKATEADPKLQSMQMEGFSQKLLELARKQRMNTDIRRNIFCIIMSAEDYLDAFEKLLHLGLKNQQEREIIHVILQCCLQEKNFNAYYAVLAQKFCEYDRKFQMTIKYSTWDKLKALTECSASQLSNLAKLLTHLFLEKGLPLSTLKIVQFADLDKTTLRFIRQILIGILLHDDVEVCQGAFTNLALSEKLKMFRESLRLFIRHFLLKNLKAGAVPEEQRQLLEERAAMVEKVLSIADRKVRF